MNGPLTGLSALEAVARMARGELPVVEYAAALLQRCQALAPLNAFITLDPQQVLREAEQRDRERGAGLPAGPLFGLPIPVKDSINTRDYPTTAGTPALRDWRPRHDAPIVQRLREAGAIVLGKTNLHELSYGWTSRNLAFGAVHNPYDTSRIPGGSSGGTAAAIAAGMAPLGVAADTEGSIRVPAALCGITGLRPTTGRYPTSGCVPISSVFDQVGPHARSVADLILFDRVAAGGPAHAAPEAAALEGVRLGVVRDYYYSGLDPELEQLCAAALARLAAAGVVLVETRLPGLKELISQATAQVQNHDVLLELPAFLAAHGAGVTFEALLAGASTDIQAMFHGEILPGCAGFVSEQAYRSALDGALPALRELLGGCLARERLDAFVFPATMVPAPRIGDEGLLRVAGREVSFTTAIARNIAPGSSAGLPGLILPVGLTRGGLPVALEFDAPAGNDRRLLALGLALERVLGALPPPRL